MIFGSSKVTFPDTFFQTHLELFELFFAQLEKCQLSSNHLGGCKNSCPGLLE